MEYKILNPDLTYEYKDVIFNLKFIKKRDDNNFLLIRTFLEGDLTFVGRDFEIFRQFVGQTNNIILREIKQDGSYYDYKVKLIFENKINYKKKTITAKTYLYDDNHFPHYHL